MNGERDQILGDYKGEFRGEFDKGKSNEAGRGITGGVVIANHILPCDETCLECEKKGDIGRCVRTKGHTGVHRCNKKHEW